MWKIITGGDRRVDFNRIKKKVRENQKEEGGAEGSENLKDSGDISSISKEINEEIK